jgi:hypothetical protein
MVRDEAGADNAPEVARALGVGSGTVAKTLHGITLPRERRPANARQATFVKAGYHSLAARWGYSWSREEAARKKALVSGEAIMLDNIGKDVVFSPPRDRKGSSKRRGRIEDEVWAEECRQDHVCKGPDCWGDYAYSSQLIRWNDGRYSIRLAYFRRPCGGDGYTFASQTTIEDDPSIIQSLLNKTLAKSAWFENPGTGF